ncbi:unnamed protein product, partial [Candidula unifasciata]
MVTITTTDVGGSQERVLHHPVTAATSSAPLVSRGRPCLTPQASKDDPVTATTITVHFEAPPSPNPSTSSQSPQAQFEFPSIPPSSNFSNHLSVKQEYSPAATLSPLQQQQLNPHASYSSPVLYNPNTDQRSTVSASSTSAASPITTPSCEISFQHRGVLRVLETWSKICQIDLEGNSLIALETREFLKRLSAMGHEYKAWCQRFGSTLRLEECIMADKATEAKEDNASIHLQYKK